MDIAIEVLAVAKLNSQIWVLRHPCRDNPAFSKLKEHHEKRIEECEKAMEVLKKMTKSHFKITFEKPVGKELQEQIVKWCESQFGLLASFTSAEECNVFYAPYIEGEDAAEFGSWFETEIGAGGSNFPLFYVKKCEKITKQGE